MAVREGKVLLVDDQQRLEIRQVERLFDQGELTVIQSGLEAGQQLIVSDLIPAVAGMPLQPQTDIDLQQALLHSAGAEQ
jgi:hypothetical protein